MLDVDVDMDVDVDVDMEKWIVDMDVDVDVDGGHREGIAGSGDHQMVARPRTPTPSMAENYSQKHNESDSGTT